MEHTADIVLIAVFVLPMAISHFCFISAVLGNLEGIAKVKSGTEICIVPYSYPCSATLPGLLLAVIGQPLTAHEAILKA